MIFQGIGNIFWVCIYLCLALYETGKENRDVIVYEVYLRRENDSGELIGVLPERRVNKERVNSESVLNWSKVLFDGTVDAHNLFFVQKSI